MLTALGERLAHAGEQTQLVVIGGSALTILGLVRRATRDVDVVALLDHGSLRPAEPLPPALAEARDTVAADFGLSTEWLNTGPADLLRLGLPEGFLERLETRRFGSALTVHLASRYDQIHFKLYALVDQGLGRHEEDLRILAPTREELVAAARWSRSHDPSPGFRRELEAVLRYLGVEDAELD
ncbi:MAG: DUF6036 family nucleotidyltransferase [Gaiellaceae bacterium]